MEERLKVSLSYGDLKAEFEGSPEEVLRSVIRFIEENLPAYSLAKRMSVTVELEGLVSALENYVGYNQQEGFFFKPPFYNLSASDQILVLLAKRYLENLWGKAEDPAYGLREITENLSMKEGTSSSKITELVKKGLVRRLDRGDYTITTTGLQELINKLTQR